MAESYGSAFFNDQAGGSIQSARQIIPLILETFEVRSVVDFGCGVGTWLKVFCECGVSDCLGLDGDYVDLEALLIPRSMFLPTDLRQRVDLNQTYDLACSLEVAEHLPASAADDFVASLTRAAPVVLFSAAIPNQGGTSHVNEQWQSYWVEKFGAHDYVPFDLVRPAVLGRDDVEWWYQQNTIVFCRKDRVAGLNLEMRSTRSYDIVHPELYNRPPEPSNVR